VVDCAALATISALLHFRRPEVTVSGNEVTIHSMEERTPVPLSIHHIPICVTFGFFSELDVIVVDPELKEECVINGRMTITMNVHKELCGIQKSGGNAIMAESVIKCSKIAAVKTAELTELMNQTLEDHWNSRKRKRDRVTPVGFDTPTPVPSHTPPSSSSSAPSSIPTPTPNSFTPVTAISTPTAPKATPKQPQENKKKQEVSPMETDNTPSFPSAAAKTEFEDFANSMATKSKDTKTDKSARKKAKVQESDSEEEEVVVMKSEEPTPPQKETQPAKSTKPKPDLGKPAPKTGNKETTKATSSAETKGDTVMSNVLDSWGAEGEGVQEISKPTPKKEEKSKPRRGADGDGKKKRTKEIISLDD
jgi:hypothetical protein